MKAAVIVFPGSNCDRDVKTALVNSKADVHMVWHGDSELPKVDLVVLPGGFSYGDYLRSGAMAAHSPILKEVVEHAGKGGHVLGVCNGFQILTEARLLPGALMRNRGLKFVCRDVHLKVETDRSVFTKGYQPKSVVRVPVAHHDGNYVDSEDALRELEDNNLIAFRYVDANGSVGEKSNPNGSMKNIAGIFNKKRTVLGMMPHPERVADPAHGGTDGKVLFDSLVEAFN